jgi:outer membrane protein assembly factor BamB
VEVGRRVSAPTAVSDQVFVALVDEHQVVCLDAKDGSRRWAFVAGGRVDSPPTWHKGRVLFGSADGSVYCLRARDGVLAWRFRAAPGHRLMAAFGQLESAWPVHGSVLVVSDTVYFAAGRSSQLDGGLYVYGLDPATGKLLHQAHLEGPDYAVEGLEQNYGLPMGALPDVLISDGSHVFMRAETFDLELKRARGRPELRTRSGLLEDSYFKRMPWTHPSGGYGRLLVQDKRSVYYVRMFDSLRGLDPTVYFTPGAKGYTLFARNLKGKSNAWMERVPVRIRAMVLAGGHLVVAGPPDVVDPKDPLGAFEGRKGGLLYVVDAESGERVGEHTLPFPPVFNGAAAARGRLYLAETDGAVSCFAR